MVASVRGGRCTPEPVREHLAVVGLYGMVFGDGAVISGSMARAQTLLGETVDSAKPGVRTPPVLDRDREVQLEVGGPGVSSTQNDATEERRTRTHDARR